jgi:hypothetical protein
MDCDIMGALQGLVPIDSTGNQLDKEFAQLVGSLMTLDNLEFKTEIRNPLAMTQLLAMAQWAESEGMEVLEITNTFCDSYKKHMVSYKRQGRAEVVRAISEIRQQMKRNIMGAEQNADDDRR